MYIPKLVMFPQYYLTHTGIRPPLSLDWKLRSKKKLQIFYSVYNIYYPLCNGCYCIWHTGHV